ncbi:MAG: 1-acyl-sn-glycerol-3-phosphate acyltransferase [Deltaproteobacteria bacterium]|nr:1-acyl-sn-glycerol-3-phosphate acyltransferase [Deltaproteobacteria bacterium]
MGIAALAATPLLRTVGWKFEGGIPFEKKYVCLAFPHTSNWDGALLVGLCQSIGLEMSWMIKNDWTRGPMGAVLRPLGAIGIDRSGSHNVVQQMIDEMKSKDALVLGIPPEGTRKRSEYWKSGFYHIALGAKVPVVPGYLDYGRKRAGLGDPIHLTGDVRADMDAIRAFYAKVAPVGRVPGDVGPIRLRDEETAAG